MVNVIIQTFCPHLGWDYVTQNTHIIHTHTHTHTHNLLCLCWYQHALAVTADASVWGIGGFISLNGTPIAYVSGIICEEDVGVLNVKRGDPKGLQTVEGLVLLVAVRLWASLRRPRQVRLALRPDSVGALSISLKGVVTV